MPDAAALRRSSALVERMCEPPADARTLRLQILDELQRVIGFDAYAWLLTDPATAVGASPVADTPWLAELPDQIRLKYCTRVNRWTALGDVPVGLLHEATGGDLAQSPVWEGLLARYGVRDIASVVFTDRFGCWAFLELWRSTGEPFTRSEAAYLADLTEPLTLALRRCQARTFVERSAREVPRAGPVALVLSPELRVRGQTPETMAYLKALIPPAPGRDPIPAVAYNVAAQLLAVEAGVDENPPTARVHVSGGLWMTARAARLGDGQDFAVTLEESSAAERVDLFCRAFGLTARERELVGHLAAGKPTREVAGCMFLSENTVQDHLKSVFAKTGLRSRPALLSCALGS